MFSRSSGAVTEALVAASTSAGLMGGSSSPGNAGKRLNRC